MHFGDVVERGDENAFRRTGVGETYLHARIAAGWNEGLSASGGHLRFYLSPN